MRYVLRKGKLVPKYSGTPGGPLVIKDIEPFETQEGVHISGRKALRDYERAMGVRQVGNDWSGPERPPFWDRVKPR
jgi:hypothetical protein